MELKKVEIPYELKNKTEKNLPFYLQNYDPFNITENWHDFNKNKIFIDNLKTLIGYNLEIFSNEKLIQKKIYGLDICIQACFLSHIEDLIRHNTAIKDTGTCIPMYLKNLEELFEGYGKINNKRTFHNSMIFSINWFNQLCNSYKSNRNLADGQFSDLLKLGIGYKNIKEEIRKNDNLLELELGKQQSLRLDFNKGKTQLNIEDRFIPIYKGRKDRFFSDILKEDNPFENKQRINFIFPVGYRNFKFPLINVTKITCYTQNYEKVFSYNNNRLKIK